MALIGDSGSALEFVGDVGLGKVVVVNGFLGASPNPYRGGLVGAVEGVADEVDFGGLKVTCVDALLGASPNPNRGGLIGVTSCGELIAGCEAGEWCRGDS